MANNEISKEIHRFCIFCKSKNPILPCKFRGRVSKNNIPTVKLRLFSEHIRMDFDCAICFNCSEKMASVGNLEQLVKRLLP